MHDRLRDEERIINAVGDVESEAPVFQRTNFPYVDVLVRNICSTSVGASRAACFDLDYILNFVMFEGLVHW